MIKNDSFDKFDYKSLRKDVKNGLLDSESFLQMIQEHLDAFVIDKDFPHQTSQKEEFVDKEYLAQWFQKNEWLKKK